MVSTSCIHPTCGCVIPVGNGYCSEPCALGTSGAVCLCNHPQCLLEASLELDGGAVSRDLLSQ